MAFALIHILIYAAIIIVLLYFAYKWLKKKQTEYHSHTYWENRYSWYEQKMDWYANYDKVNQDFKIDEVIQENFPDKKKSKIKILELGCGNSDFAIDMYNKGYTNYTAIDFSKIVINQMIQKFQGKKINFLCADFLHLDNIFEKEEFDIAIEKAGLDSIATKETPDVPDLLYIAYNQIHYVLKENGILLSVSSKNPDFWKKNALTRLEQENLFKIVQIRRTVFTIKNNPMLMNYYFYYLKKTFPNNKQKNNL